MFNVILLYQERYKFIKMEKFNDLEKNFIFWFICFVVSRRGQDNMVVFDSEFDLLMGYKLVVINVL